MRSDKSQLRTDKNPCQFDLTYSFIRSVYRCVKSIRLLERLQQLRFLNKFWEWRNYSFVIVSKCSYQASSSNLRQATQRLYIFVMNWYEVVMGIGTARGGRRTCNAEFTGEFESHKIHKLKNALRGLHSLLMTWLWSIENVFQTFSSLPETAVFDAV